MIECIADNMRKKLCSTIRDNERKIAIIIDESTSVSKKSCLIIYIRAVIVETPENVFLDMRELEGQDAESVFKCLLTTLAEFGFDEDYLSKNLIAFTSDGTSVMLGIHSGVGQRLKEKIPALLLWHCLNHRLELAISDAVLSIDGFYPIQTFFDKIYSVYSYSSKLQRELSEISRDLDLQLKKVGKIFTVRWIASSFRAIKALWNDYPALYSHFKKLSEDKSIKSTDRATYQGIVKKLSTREFVEDVAIVKDCLAQLSLLSEALQRQQTSLVEANRHLQWTLNALFRIKEAIQQGKYAFQSTTGDNAGFKGVSLEAFSSRKGYVSFDRKQFIQALIDNINARMINPSNEAVIRQLEALIPDKWPTGECPPWSEGETAITAICQRFHVPECGIIPAYREYFYDPRRTPKIINEKLIQSILYTIPISSSEAERGFSQMNLVCSPTRSKLTVLNMSSLLFVSINGPPPHLWNAQPAVANWLLKHRSATDTKSRKAKLVSLSDLNSVQSIFT